jgi:lysyl-tRNA synthetase class 2
MDEKKTEERKIEDEKQDVSPAQYNAWRVAKLDKREKETGIKTYPHKFHTTCSVKEFIEKYTGLVNEASIESVSWNIAGRVTNKRESSSKLVFLDLVGEGDKIQVYLSAAILGQDNVEIIGTINRGDIIGVSGYPMRTKRGELSIVPTKVELLTPCILMLPKTLTDQETRYRQRYLDLIINQTRERDIFVTRSKIIKYIRNFLDERRFLEVETPMMGSIVGGAAARPFITRHNDLGIDLLMRISPELQLKMLVVGGFERVYELGRQMRNEGIDLTHNPEFTSCEFYMAYADYKDLIEITQELFSGMVRTIRGSLKITMMPFAGDSRTEPVEIDFTPPYRQIRMIPELERICGEKLPRPLDGPECNKFLASFCEKKGLVCSPPTTTARLIDKLVGEYIEPQCINPTFIIGHPQLMSPLAKYDRDDPELTERFEMFINQKEIVNAYTELNNPHVQRQCFADQLKDKAAGDDEAQMIDENFCTALDYGLPPTSGWGVGLDRLTMMLTAQPNIKEVLLFPAMKPVQDKLKPVQDK